MRLHLTHKKIIYVLKKLKTTKNKLSGNELLDVLEHIKQISIDKTTLDLIIKSVNLLISKDLTNTNVLTDRETQILLMISKGLKNSEIAEQLNLSKSTIETHRKNIRKKLKLKSNDSLFAFALVFSLQSKSHHNFGGNMMREGKE